MFGGSQQQPPAQPHAAPPPPAAQQPTTPNVAKTRQPPAPPKPAVTNAQREACTQSKSVEKTIDGCSAIIKNAAKENKANLASAYDNRGAAYTELGKFEQAVADHTQAIQIKTDGGYFANRAAAYSAKGDNDKAIADLTQAIALQPENANAYTIRASAYVKKGLFDQAIADATMAINLKPELAAAYESRGHASFMKDDLDTALTDLDQAITLKPTLIGAHTVRGMLYEKQGDMRKATADYGAAASSSASSANDKQNQAQARQRLASLAANPVVSRSAPDKAKQEQQAALDTEKRKNEEMERRLAALETNRSNSASVAPAASGDTMGAAFDPGRRVALIIANSKYEGFSPLKNPSNDGKDVAATLRRLGFAEVIEVYDASKSQMESALKEFGDKTSDADWAVIFYSGHGMQVDGQNYLIPVDAKLMRAKHVEDETVSLERVRDKVRDAKQLRLVMLDACRNNPFQSRMVADAGGKRAVGRGLGRIEASAGELVAFATKEGNVADDGDARNSPFTKALLSHIETPGLELNMMLRKVHDSVLKETASVQEPYTYGALPGDALYFKGAAAPAASAQK